MAQVVRVCVSLAVGYFGAAQLSKLYNGKKGAGADKKGHRSASMSPGSLTLLCPRSSVQRTCSCSFPRRVRSARTSSTKFLPITIVTNRVTPSADKLQLTCHLTGLIG